MRPNANRTHCLCHACLSSQTNVRTFGFLNRWSIVTLSPFTGPSCLVRFDPRWHVRQLCVRTQTYLQLGYACTLALSSTTLHDGMYIYIRQGYPLHERYIYVIGRIHSKACLSIIYTSFAIVVEDTCANIHVASKFNNKLFVQRRVRGGGDAEEVR